MAPLYLDISYILRMAARVTKKKQSMVNETEKKRKRYIKIKFCLASIMAIYNGSRKNVSSVGKGIDLKDERVGYVWT